MAAGAGVALVVVVVVAGAVLLETAVPAAGAGAGAVFAAPFPFPFPVLANFFSLSAAACFAFLACAEREKISLMPSSHVLRTSGEAARRWKERS